MSKRERRSRIIAAIKAEDSGAIAAIAAEDPEVVNARNAHWNVPLADAIRTGNLAIVEKLVDLGADPEHRNHGGRSMLDAAAFSGRREIAQFLIRRGATPSILHHAALGDIGRVRARWEPNPELIPAGGRWRMAPLHAAVRAGNIQAVTALLKFCAPDPTDHNDHTPLALVPELPAEVPHADIASVLIDAGANLDVMAGHFRGTVIHRAIVNGHLDLTQLLVRRGADLCRRDHAGKTPLHEAVAKGVGFLRAVLEGVVDHDICTNDGETALAYARRRKKKTAVRLLQAAVG